MQPSHLTQLEADLLLRAMDNNPNPDLKRFPDEQSGEFYGWEHLEILVELADHGLVEYTEAGWKTTKAGVNRLPKGSTLWHIKLG